LSSLQHEVQPEEEKEVTDPELCKVLKITPIELEQLQTYIRWAEEDGAYYGPKAHFDKRHQNIRKALNLSPIPMTYRVGLHITPEMGSEGGPCYWTNIQEIAASNPEEACAIYNRKNSCNYYYGAIAPKSAKSYQETVDPTGESSGF
jgi:hypothetical protein